MNKSAAAITQELGKRLKQARLNIDLTQAEVASRSGLTRKAVINAEKGKAQLQTLVTIMLALGLEDHLNAFLPAQEISPIQLAKLQGKKRQRASRQQNSPEKESSEW